MKSKKLMLSPTLVMVTLVLVALVCIFTTPVPTTYAEEQTPTPYFTNNRTETIVVNGEKIDIKLEGSDVLWPFADSISVGLSSHSGNQFYYELSIELYYHRGGNSAENPDFCDSGKWNGTATSPVTFKLEGRDNNHGGTKYNKYDVIRAKVEVSITVKGVRDSRAYDVLYHL